MRQKTNRFYSVLLIALGLFISSNSFAQQKFSESFSSKIDQFQEVKESKPFEFTAAQRGIDELNQYTTLKLDQSFVNEDLNRNEFLNKLKIPVSDDLEFTLLLQQTNILDEDFTLKYSSGNTDKDTKNIYYWGMVEGYENSLVSLTVTENQIFSVIAIQDKIYNLGKLSDGDDYVIYEKNALLTPPTTDCFSDDILDFSVENIEEFATRDANNCVNMYVEVDKDIYDSKTTGTFDFITAVFSQVSLLYANDGINLQISELKIWDTNDPYSGPSTSDYLNQFRDALNGNYNGDLAHLVGYAGGGGIAYVNVLCNGLYGVGYSGINSGYNNVPAYSWTVEVLTHEIGHNLGSPHTHSCSWTGGQIDDCGNIYLANNGGNPGSCYDANNPILPESGTIMSYCHLVSGVGIDFVNGFGQQPGDLVRSNVYNASCLTACGSACDPGTACNDFDDCTTGDVYDIDCNCAGVLADEDGDGVCDAEDVCQGFDDNMDSDGDGIADGCDDCFDEQVTFTDSSLSHSGPGSSTSTASFTTITTSSVFTISGLSARTGGKPANRYIEKAVVSYVDGNGNLVTEGTYLGTGPSSVEISLSNSASSVIVTLSDDYDGNSSTIMNIALSAVSTCPSDDCLDSDNDGVCDVDDICPDGDDNIDLNENGIPDDCEGGCVDLTTNFSTNTLNHIGTGSTTSSLNFQEGDLDASFTITGLGSKVNGNPNSRYIDVVTVKYVDGNGNTVNYGTFQGDQQSSVNVAITGEVASINVSLSDGYDGNAGSTISVDLGEVSYCGIPNLSETFNNSISTKGTMNAYPNPFDDQISVNITNDKAEIFTASLLDITGKEIIAPVAYNTSNFSVPIEGITKGGVYILKVVSDQDNTYILRLISMK